MKNKLYVSILFLISVCKLNATDCIISTFKTNYNDNINNENVFFIRAQKISTKYHGMSIKVLENFKNNKINDTITLWCSDGNSLRYEKADSYSDGDTLLLLITYCDLEGNEDNGTIPDTFEKANDYMPIHCSISILQYQQDSIFGNFDSLSAESKIDYNTFLKQLGINNLIDTNLKTLQSLEGKWYCVYYLNTETGLKDTITPERTKQQICINIELNDNGQNDVHYSLFVNNIHLYDTIIKPEMFENKIICTESLIPKEIRNYSLLLNDETTYTLTPQKDSMLLLTLSYSKDEYIFHRDSTYRLNNYYFERLSNLKPGLYGKWHWENSSGMISFSPNDAGYNLSIAFDEYKQDRPDSILFKLYKNDTLCFSKPLNLEINHNNRISVNETIIPKEYSGYLYYESVNRNIPPIEFFLKDNNLSFKLQDAVDATFHCFILDSLYIQQRQKDTILHSLCRLLDSEWYFFLQGSSLGSDNSTETNQHKICLKITYDSLEVKNNVISGIVSENDIQLEQNDIQIEYHTDSTLLLSSDVFPLDLSLFGNNVDFSNYIVSFSSDTALYFKPDAESNNNRYCFTKNYIEHVPVGLSKPHRDDKILIYNNFSNTLSIVNPDNVQIAKIEIIDIAGKKVYEKPVASDKDYFGIELDNSFNGFYIVNVISKASIFSEKIFIIK